MSNVFFTSDTHFYHEQDFLYSPRGFSCMEEMNEGIIERWNSVVREGDIVWHLGDVLMGHYDKSILKRLNGTICFIRGNHDTLRKISEIEGIEQSQAHWPTSELMKFGKISIFACHYPTLTANFDDKHFNQHVIALHGHTHQKGNWMYPDNPFLYHVGLDSHNCYPVHIDEILADVRQRWLTVGSLPESARSKPLYEYPNE